MLPTWLDSRLKDTSTNIPLIQEKTKQMKGRSNKPDRHSPDKKEQYKIPRRKAPTQNSSGSSISQEKTRVQKADTPVKGQETQREKKTYDQERDTIKDLRIVDKKITEDWSSEHTNSKSIDVISTDDNYL
jgi:hypothetical protein